MAYLLITDPSIAALGLDDVTAQALIDAASGVVDAYCKRTFSLASAATRYYVANRGEVLTDDVADPAAVAVSYRLSDDDDWEDIDAPTWAPYNGLPKERIVNLPEATVPHNIRVVGTIGYGSTVPAPVVMAVRLMAVRLGERTRQGYATRRETIGEYGITYATPDDLTGYSLEPAERMLLDPYRKIRFGTMEGIG